MTVFNKDQEILDKLEIVEDHFHSNEHWFGKSTDQSGNLWGDAGMVPYQVITGVSCAYSTAAADVAKVIGSSNTPVTAGMKIFCMHRVVVTAVSTNEIFKIRSVYGPTTKTLNENITAGRVSEAMFKLDALNPQQSVGVPVGYEMPRTTAGSKVWFQAKSVGTSETLDFFVGLHESLE